jgi:acyl-CoA synthetase (AMP-forming)/AMP-acid ligase II
MESYNGAAWLLDRHVEDGHGSRVAIRCGGDSHTYDDVLGEVWRVQHALEDLGIVAGTRVALVVNDEPAFVAWFLGCLRSGVVPVPLSTMLTGDELAAIVADAGATAVVTSAQERLTPPRRRRRTRGRSSPTPARRRSPRPLRTRRRSGCTARGPRACRKG